MRGRDIIEVLGGLIARTSGRTFAEVALVAALVLVVLRWHGRRDPKRLADRADRHEVYRTWGRRCAYRWVTWHRCAGPLQIDHQRPHSHGGRSTVRNFQPLCQSHNVRWKRTTSNARFVWNNAIPIVGHAIYLRRWCRAALRAHRR